MLGEKQRLRQWKYIGSLKKEKWLDAETESEVNVFGSGEKTWNDSVENDNKLNVDIWDNEKTDTEVWEKQLPCRDISWQVSLTSNFQ